MNQPTEQSQSAGQLIEEYLNRLSAQLGALPLEVQQETREELRQHLQLLVKRQGNPHQITESALRQFGDPTEIGQRLALEWEEGEWSLSGLPLLQRIDRIREAGGTEMALQTVSLPLKALNYFQVLILLVYASPLSTMSGGHLSSLHVSGTQLGLLGLYFVVGMVACFFEWAAIARPGLLPGSNTGQDRNRAIRNIIGRVGIAILLPCLFLFPDQGWFIIGGLLLLSLILWAMGHAQSSPRARLALNGQMTYSLLMGLVGGVIIGATLRLFSWLGFESWLSLLLAPCFYYLGRWIWKRPQSKS